MNNLSLILGIVILALSIVLIFVGGWEKFHLQRDNNAWLALFILGWIGFIGGVGLIILGILSNRKMKVSPDQLSIITPTGKIPVTELVKPASTNMNTSSMMPTSIVPKVNESKTVSDMLNNVLSDSPSVFNIPMTKPVKRNTGTIIYDKLEPTSYPGSLKGGLFD